MGDLALARALHVLAVVLWIGGVGMVTTSLLPALLQLPDPAQRIAIFEAVERRFAMQARILVLVAGLSGLYLLVRLHAWDRFTLLPYWWMHTMVLVWLVFAAILFLLEPLVLHRRFGRAMSDSEATLRAVHRLHWGLLALSLLTILGAVAGSHGLLLLE